MSTASCLARSEASSGLRATAAWRWKVAGAICRTRQIGSTPKTSRCSSMKAIICGTGGRAPPGQNRRSPMSLGPLARHWLTLLQALVGRAQFLDLALQLLDPGLLFAARSAAFARVTRRLDAPAAQSVMGAAELRCNRAVGRVVARVIGPVFAIQSDAALAELGR